ncbi:heat shock protein, Hsp20 family [Methyloglobulus morosus KoM1]|uniref:Heat shock protein, Hsp20 family n=1 Tax=Methyloglobulus morosus KoM1 TaxID=1116472 RepID=V5DT86_9GAMM|nr:HDOD domain-containing protein [Methyloglobulus morosus]ESS70611.1 heat shock protein, Hsp20 family [Methyloglobulus morosus KoM1]
MQQNSMEYLLADFLQKYHGKIRIATLKMNIHRLISALADDEIEPKNLAAILHHYPVISARLVGLANSPWARSATPITSIESACIWLGSKQVKAVSIAIAVGSSFNITRCHSFDPVRFWSTSMLVAEGAGLLASKLPDNARYSTDRWQTLKTAGILHNLGLLWLADMLPAETEQAFKLTAADPSLAVDQALIKSIGIDFCTVGAWVGKQWHIPDELVAIIANHRKIGYQENRPVQELLVGAAARMVSSLFHERHVTTDLDLTAIGLEPELQQIIFEQLSKKLDSTKELARLILK